MKMAGLKITSIFLTLVLLMSTKPITLKKQYCGNNLIKVVLFSTNNSINLELESNKNECCYLNEKDCCSFEYQITNNQIDVFTNTAKYPEFGKDKQSVASDFLQDPYGYANDPPRKAHYIKEYSPPNLVHNTNLLYQVFRI